MAPCHHWKKKLTSGVAIDHQMLGFPGWAIPVQPKMGCTIPSRDTVGWTPRCHPRWSGQHVWLVVWNMAFMTFHSYWECHHPNWRTHIFQRGRLNHQPGMVFCCMYLCFFRSETHPAGGWCWMLRCFASAAAFPASLWRWVRKLIWRWEMQERGLVNIHRRMTMIIFFLVD